jgi:hypothetical protein
MPIFIATLALATTFSVLSVDHPAEAQEPPPLVVELGESVVIKPLDIPQEELGFEHLIEEYAALYNLDYERFKAVQECENKYLVPQSLHKDPKGPNGQENSWGPWQINLDAHPHITRAQALDPDFSTRWSAQQWSKGYAKKWTCYRKPRS